MFHPKSWNQKISVPILIGSSKVNPCKPNMFGIAGSCEFVFRGVMKVLDSELMMITLEVVLL